MKKITPLLMVLPLCLTACQTWEQMFGDDDHHKAYSSEYSNTQYDDAKKMDTKAAASKTKRASSGQSGTAATSVTTPATTDRKGSGVPLDAPAVPSMATPAQAPAPVAAPAQAAAPAAAPAPTVTTAGSKPSVTEKAPKSKTSSSDSSATTAPTSPAPAAPAVSQ